MSEGELPSLYSAYIQRARYVDEIDLTNPEGRTFVVMVTPEEGSAGWPSMVLSQRFQDAQTAFNPGLHYVPEKDLLFVGAGERLLCYDLKAGKRIWEDETPCGFWQWSRHDQYILMSAELEFSVWSQCGRKLWSTWVEPPWDYRIAEDIVTLSFEGIEVKYRLDTGHKVP